MYTFFCSLFYAILFCILPLNAAAALTDEEMCNLLDELLAAQPEIPEYWTRPIYNCRIDFWIRFQPKTLEEILTNKESAAYRQTLDEGRCIDASDLLRKCFADAHPDTPSILANKSDYNAWRSLTVANHYKGLHSCFQLESLRQARKDVDRSGIKVPLFRGYERSLGGTSYANLPTPLASLYHKVYGLFLYSRHLERPKLALALLNLSSEGKVIRLHREYEYYLAYWLHTSGRKDSVVQKVLGRSLDEQRRKYIARMVKRRRIKGIPIYPEQ